MVSKNLIQRFFSMVILIPLVLYIIYLNNVVFDIVVAAIGLLMLIEWFNMTVRPNKKNPVTWGVIGIIAIAIICSSFVVIMNNKNGQLLVAWLLVNIWSTDVIAFLCGKLIGGAKLAPRISPKKTWAGLIGGVIGATFICSFFKPYIYKGDYVMFSALNILIAVTAQVGDLLESWVKRKFNIKDSGSIIPGHGGILDRVDGFTLTAPLLLYILMVDRWGLFI